MYVVALVVLGSAELKARVPQRKKKKSNMLCAAVCGNSAAASWNKSFFFLRCHLVKVCIPTASGKKSCFYSLLIIAISRFLVRFLILKLRQQEEKRHKPTNIVIFICG